MPDTQERGHATIQVDRLLSRCFPGMPVLKLTGLRSCAIEKATQALRGKSDGQIDEELGLYLYHALQLLPEGDIRAHASRTFNRGYKAIPANYAVFQAATVDHQAPSKLRKKF